jgi:F420-dependent oxidoreductase-like protein
MANLRFGVKTAQHHASYEDMLRVWNEADGIEVFDHAWLFDHFAPIQGDLDGPCLDGWSLLAALAAETQRIRLGLMVTGNTYRHPAILAKIATTVDVVSNGRLDFGIGAGWNEYEHHSMGIPLDPPGKRLRRFEEACEIWKRLFTQHLTDFDGRYYQLKDARNEPKPVQKPYPPFVIGGSGEQITLRIVAKYADVWNFNGRDVETFNHKLNVLRKHCDEVGRDISEIELSIQIMVDYDDLGMTIKQVQEFVDAGCTHIILNLRSPYPEDIATTLAEQVVPKINAD